jgi:sec-independent protein translocase protein TatA
MGLDNPLHLAFLLLILLLVFGAKRLPEIGRSLGSGMRGFKSAITGAEEAGVAGAGQSPHAHDLQVVADGGRSAALPLPAGGAHDAPQAIAAHAWQPPHSEPPRPEAA